MLTLPYNQPAGEAYYHNYTPANNQGRDKIPRAYFSDACGSKRLEYDICDEADEDDDGLSGSN